MSGVGISTEDEIGGSFGAAVTKVAKEAEGSG